MVALQQGDVKIIVVTIPMSFAPMFSSMLFAQNVSLYSYAPLTKGNRLGQVQMSMNEWVNFPVERTGPLHRKTSAEETSATQKTSCCLEVRGERPLTLVRAFAEKNSLKIEESELIPV